jgi:hypothetical protein
MTIDPRRPTHTHAAPTPDPGAGASPLNADHLRALAEGRLRARKVRRAANVAATSGWTLAAFAGLTALGALFGDLVALALGGALGALAYNELRGSAMLRRLEPRGARILGYNQIALGALIVAYSAWSLVAALGSPALASLGGATGDPQTDAMLSSLTGMMTYGLYGTLGAVGLIVPGLTALYYFTRARVVRTVLAQTPPWVIDAMRATT